MTEPLPAEHAADVWQEHRAAFDALSAELAGHDPILARSLEGAMKLRDAILVELVGGRVASDAFHEGALKHLGQRIVAEAQRVAGHGDQAAQAGGQ